MMRLCLSLQEKQKKLDKINISLTSIRPLKVEDFLKSSTYDKYLLIVNKDVYEWIKKIK